MPRRLLALTVAALALAAQAAGAKGPPQPASIVVWNAVERLMEQDASSCPLTRWRILTVRHAAFPGIDHPRRGKLLWLVTVRLEWSGLMVAHQGSWTVVGSSILPADTSKLPGVVYRDPETAWIAGFCQGDPKFSRI